MAESRAQTNVHDVDEMPPEWANKLEAAGYDDLDSLVNASVDDLLAIEGIDDEVAGKIIELARQHEEIEETGEVGEEAEGEEGEAVAEEAQPGEEKPEEAQVE
jgi:reverse gyrase